jgi:hypothetical protein
MAMLSEVKPDIIKELSPYLFYKIDGTYLAGKTNIAATVYVTEEEFDEKTKKTREEWDTIKENSNVLFLNYGNLLEISAIANGEAWQAEPQDMQKRELFAIANSIVNFISKSTNGLSKGYSYARDDKTTGYTQIKDVEAKEKNNNWRLKTAMASGINALLEDGADYANGATHWDGIDVLKNDKHYRYGAHTYFSYIKGIYDPENLRQSFYNNAMQYGNGKNKIEPLIVVDEKVEWGLGIESEKSVMEGQKGGKNKYFELIGEDNKVVSKDLYNAIYKGPGHNLWYYPKNISLYNVVAQEGLSIFYTITEKVNSDEILEY